MCFASLLTTPKIQKCVKNAKKHCDEISQNFFNAAVSGPSARYQYRSVRWAMSKKD